MKQLIQSLKNGDVWAQDAPAPAVCPGHLLVQTTTSLVSAGTERMLVEFGRGSYWAKARQQPDKVRQVLDKVRTDGLGPTVQSVRAKLDDPLPMGYSNVGRVLQVGDGVSGFRPGDRVVSNGRHAQVVLVPKHLCAPVPDSVRDDQAAFTVLGAIALHGIRLIGPTLGESVAVFGLGLIGLLAVQILRAHGATVIGFDYNSGRVELAKQFGVMAWDLSAGTDAVAAANQATKGMGVDGVLVTAATKSDELMHQAAQMCRKRGRIVLTGVTGLNLRRDDFYEKELTFQVSCSYGPGRYDADYEVLGQDYPIGFVRWTEQRNFQAILDLMARNQLVTQPLVSLEVPLDDAPEAYQTLNRPDVIGVLLRYPVADEVEAKAKEPRTGSADEGGGESIGPVSSVGPVERVVRHRSPGNATPVLAMIGAGGFARQKILPALVKTGARLKWACTATGLTAATAATKFGIEQSTTEIDRVLGDPEVDAVVIATRHNSHASLVLRSLQAGKSVFVEKPLCLNQQELDQIIVAYGEGGAEGQSGEGAEGQVGRRPLLMVGYNRRFAPLVQRVKSTLAGRTSPLAMIFTCNAGYIPADHWTQDPAVGGGRILGEACHFVDLLHYLADEAPIHGSSALRMGPVHEPGDTVAITLQFADGSLGQINYFSNGPKRFPKERLEVFCEGRALRLDNFRRLEGIGTGMPNQRTWTQDKGHFQGFQAFVDALRNGGSSPIPFDSLIETTRATLEINDSL